MLTMQEKVIDPPIRFSQCLQDLVGCLQTMRFTKFGVRIVPPSNVRVNRPKSKHTKTNFNREYQRMEAYYSNKANLLNKNLNMSVGMLAPLGQTSTSNLSYHRNRSRKISAHPRKRDRTFDDSSMNTTTVGQMLKNRASDKQLNADITKNERGSIESNDSGVVKKQVNFKSPEKQPSSGDQAQEPAQPQRTPSSAHKGPPSPERSRLQFEFPATEGLYIKNPDAPKLSPRDFLRIGKVQKQHEKPMTDENVKHRDRAYIIKKLNKSIHEMQGEDCKKIKAKNDITSLIGQKMSGGAKKLNESLYMNKSDAITQAKLRGKSSGGKDDKLLPSQIYLQKYTKDSPMIIGHQPPHIGDNLSMTFGTTAKKSMHNSHISGADMH